MVNFVCISSFIQTDCSCMKKNCLNPILHKLCSLLIDKAPADSHSNLGPMPEKSKEHILEELHRNASLSYRQLEPILFYLPTTSNTPLCSFKLEPLKKKTKKKISTSALSQSTLGTASKPKSSYFRIRHPTKISKKVMKGTSTKQFS